MNWRGSWIDVPAQHPVAGSILLEVEASAPLLALESAHGRRLERPLRKVVSFALTDGPLAALRKARAKRAEPAMTGDLHLVVALGREMGASAGSPRLVALVARAPRCADLMLTPASLAREVAQEFGHQELAAVASALRRESDALAPHARQSYLYSGMEPPVELGAALDRALAAPATSDATVEVMTAPGLDGTASETIATGHGGGSAGPPLAQLGAGDYVRIEVAPALAGFELDRRVIADREPQIAIRAAAELGFATATTDARGAIDSLDRRGIVLIATAHDSHASLAAHALDAGHRVVCEKPAIVTPRDLDLLAAAAERHPGELEIGFNRRHHPLVERARRLVGAEEGPATIVAAIREVDINSDHWYLWPNQGTRVAGNLCHWIDLAVHLLGPDRRATSIAVSPRISADPREADAERSFTITFDDGSVACLIPTTRGDSVRGVQEQIDIRRGDLALRLDDLWRLTGVRRGVPIHRRTVWRGKGHEAMYRRMLERFDAGLSSSYPHEDLIRVGEIQLAATEAVRSDQLGGSIDDLLASARDRDTSSRIAA